jgi:hypothetical protein
MRVRLIIGAHDVEHTGPRVHTHVSKGELVHASPIPTHPPAFLQLYLAIDRHTPSYKATP